MSDAAPHRILVIGISGAGKSTFARARAARTGLPLIHLDQEFWQPGWVVTPREPWRARVALLAARETWIMDGSFDGSLDLRLPRADCVVWFDTSAPRAIGRVLRRIAASYGQVRPDLAPGCPEQWDWSFLSYIWNFNGRERPRIAAALGLYARHLNPIMIRSDAEAARVLAAIPARA